jgi:hypothetical protein
MDNEAIDELAQFCADQYYCFDAEQWMQKTTQYRRACLALAGYLSRTSWYGHSEQLDRVGTLARSQLADAADAVNSQDQETLDIARFSARIRVRIAQMRLQVPVQRALKHQQCRDTLCGILPTTLSGSPRRCHALLTARPTLRGAFTPMALPLNA